MIELLVPDMPTTDDLITYLRCIDENKTYTNNGPLVQELEAKLELITGVPCVALSNCTVALELSIKSIEHCLIPKPPVAIIPALTFSATGLAAINAGYDVALVDVDFLTWQLSRELLVDWSNKNFYPLHDIGVVMPVATFGRPVEIKQWENLNIPVVIDAAGAFPHQDVSKDPNIATCFSLHATKFIGCGEGGFVASNNPELIAKIRSLSNFGEKRHKCKNERISCCSCIGFD